MIPSLLYEQDQDGGNFMRFREARAVRVQKDFMMQLCTTDFRSLARCMEQFVSRVRHGIFLFCLEEGCASGVRAFRASHCFTQLQVQAADV
jgi:hypothetical protein